MIVVSEHGLLVVLADRNIMAQDRIRRDGAGGGRKRAVAA